MTTTRQALAWAETSLRGAGIEAAGAESRILLSYALGCEPSQLALVETIDADQEAILKRVVVARGSGAPLQHVMGRAYFRTISVRVGPGVFIPRPETEMLAGWAIDQVRAGQTRVVELCAGSGAISLAVATESRPANQWAVEISEPAYAYLVANLQDSCVEAVRADMAGALKDLNGTINMVVANPPYISEGQRLMLAPEVLADPEVALFSGRDGYEAIAVVAEVAMRLLSPGSVVGIEHGDEQGERTRAILAEAGFVDVVTHLDLNSRPRFVTARKDELGHGKMVS